MVAPLMPKATAIWLIDNTALTFDQIADFCGLHALEVKGIADGDVAQGIKAMDPISNGQLTRSELERCQADPSAKLVLAKSKRDLPTPKKQKGGKYTPLSKRQGRPDAIYWLVRNHGELNDTQISRLVGTTKPTIQNIRNRTHWNMSNLKPVDPVALGLCKQIDLDREVARAARRVERANKEQKKQEQQQAAALSPIDSAPIDSAPIDSAPTAPMDTPTPPLDDMSQTHKSDKTDETERANIFADLPDTEKQKEEDSAPDVDTVFGNFEKAAPDSKGDS